MDSGEDFDESVLQHIVGIVVIGHISVNDSHEHGRMSVEEFSLSTCDAPLTTLTDFFFAHHDEVLLKHTKCKITASFVEKKLFPIKNALHHHDDGNWLASIDCGFTL